MRTRSLERRHFLAMCAAGLSAGSAACVPRMPVRSVYESMIPAEPATLLVNDVHSQLNPTRVGQIVKPPTVDALAAAVADASHEARAICVAGGRHAMGGQQFAEHTGPTGSCRRPTRTDITPISIAPSAPGLRPPR